MTRESRAKQIFINTVSGLGGLAGNALIGLILTPFLISRLGFEPYGFWIVLSTAVNYVGLMDLGIETTFIKYVAEYTARGEWRQAREVVTFGVLFYCALAAAFAPLAYVLATPIVGVMKVSPALAAQGPRLFFWITAAFFLQSAGGVIGSLLGGIGMLRLVTLGTFASRIAFAVACVVLTGRGLGITALIVATFLQIGIASAFFAVMALRFTSRIFVNPFCLEREVIKRLFKLGGWIQVTNLASTVTLETSRLIIAIFVQTASVTTFEVANKLTRTMRSVPFNFVVALLPAVSAMDAAGEAEAFNCMYIRATRYLNAATCFLVGFVVICAQPVCLLWLGRVYPGVPFAVAMLGLSFILVNLTAIGTCMLRAIAKPQYEAYYFLVFAAASIAAMLALVPSFKLEGVLIGTLIGSAVSTAYFLRIFHSLRRLPVGVGLFAWSWKLATACGGAMLAVHLALIAMPPAVFSGRARGCLEVLLLGALYGAVFAAVMMATRFFDSSDWDLLSRIMPRGVRRLSRIFPAHVAQGRL